MMKVINAEYLLPPSAVNMTHSWSGDSSILKIGEHEAIRVMRADNPADVFLSLIEEMNFSEGADAKWPTLISAPSLPDTF